MEITPNNQGVYTITSGAALLNWMAFMGADTKNVIAGTAGLVASFAVAFILTMVFGIGREDGSSDLGADEELLS